MKKLISIALVAIMMLSIVSVSANAADVDSLTSGERALLILQRADINGDGQYSTDDAAIILKAAAGIVPVDNAEYYDVDLDGYVSVRDAQLMLGVVTGSKTLLTTNEALESFNTILNGVKSKKPGFAKTSTLVLPTVKVTTKGASLSSLNVNNMEFSAYVDKVIDLYQSLGGLLGGIDDSAVQELQSMKTEMYNPQVESKTVATGSNSHYSYFPVNNLGWSSKLTSADIKSMTYTVSGGYIVYTINMGDYTYTGDAYPTGSKGFSDRQKLPYGKIFNIPSLDEDASTTLNSVKFQKGKVVLKADLLTGNVVSVDYSYSYVTDTTVDSGDGMTMRMVTTANVSEAFTMLT